MPDMIETYAGPVAWWEGKSPTMVSRTLLNQDLSSDEMLEAASLKWTVSKRLLTYFSAAGDAACESDRYATVRDTDDQYLGCVKHDYQVVQNDELAELGDALKGEGAKWHTAGSLFGGKQVWLQAQIDRDLFIDGDSSKYANYILVRNGHDGNHTLSFDVTPTRVVCANTMAAAIEGAVGHMSLRHTANVANRVDEVRKALGMAEQYINRFEEVANAMAAVPMSLSEFDAFTEKLLPANPQVEHATRTEAQRLAIRSLFTSSPTLVGVSDSRYRAFQAVAEYTDHIVVYSNTKSGQAADKRAASIIEGKAFDVKSSALKLLVPAR